MTEVESKCTLATVAISTFSGELRERGRLVAHAIRTTANIDCTGCSFHSSITSDWCPTPELSAGSATDSANDLLRPHCVSIGNGSAIDVDPQLIDRGITRRTGRLLTLTARIGRFLSR